jgi:hypothetical protein
LGKKLVDVKNIAMILSGPFPINGGIVLWTIKSQFFPHLRFQNSWDQSTELNLAMLVALHLAACNAMYYTTFGSHRLHLYA